VTYEASSKIENATQTEKAGPVGTYEKPRISFSTHIGDTNLILASIFKDPERKDRITFHQHIDNMHLMFEFAVDTDVEIIIEYMKGVLIDLSERYKTIQLHSNYHTAHKKYDFDRYTLDGLYDHIRMLLKLMSSYHTLYITKNE
jgi:GH15 family glucan-1,4-alpha-glucosidase